MQVRSKGALLALESCSMSGEHHQLVKIYREGLLLLQIEVEMSILYASKAINLHFPGRFPNGGFTHILLCFIVTALAN